jgi:GMP synthase (glutamine-hydrolysing)
LQFTRLFDGDALPQQNLFDWLAVMSGPMSVHDTEQFAWLKAEKRCIVEAIAEEKTVLGICLGAQLIADVMGAPVTLNAQRENGWFPLESCGTSPRRQGLPEAFTAFHWHGETFALPENAMHLARSEACANQTFAYGSHVLVLQFHLEVMPDSVRKLVEFGGGELKPATLVQDATTILAQQEHYAASNRCMNQLLDNLAQPSTFMAL